MRDKKYIPSITKSPRQYATEIMKAKRQKKAELLNLVPPEWKGLVMTHVRIAVQKGDNRLFDDPMFWM